MVGALFSEKTACNPRVLRSYNLDSSGAKAMLAVNVMSNPRVLCTFAVLYQPPLILAPSEFASGRMYSVSIFWASSTPPASIIPISSTCEKPGAMVSTERQVPAMMVLMDFFIVLSV